MRTKPEILAPAGSYAGLQAAVAAGCDAVYIGGMLFGARAYAEHPDTDTMIQAIEYCHLHGVKLYLTVNTLLKDQELRDLLYDYMIPFYEAGLDAVIVQDFGVVRALHQWFPALELHASTQMNLVMGKGMERLKQYGITRIVPARELSLPELEQMRQDTDLELEVFVHGALCYCYSGRCLFSSMQGGRSGNRGRCTQPCRMLYHRKGQPGYYLSPKELCNLPYLPELIEAGMDSFKIEGRMKRPEYTAFVTSVYRKYVDLYHELGQKGFSRWKQEHQAQWQDDQRKLAELYNREGFTSGYLEGKTILESDRKSEQVSMLSGKRPRHGGVKVGTVVSVDRHFAVYQLERDIYAQDVVEFRDAKGQTIYEYTVGADDSPGKQVHARYRKGCRIQPGDKVYRTRHQRLLDEIAKNYLGAEEPLAVTGTFVAEPGRECILTVNRQDHFVTVTGDVVSQAVKQPTTEESVRKALCQTGGSRFCFAELEIVLQEHSADAQRTANVFLPVGMLKKMRREALQKLEDALLADSRRTANPERMEQNEIFIEQMRQEKKSRIDEREMSEEEECTRVMTEQKTLPIVQTVRDRELFYSAAVMTLGQLQAVLSAEMVQVQEVILRMDKMTEEELLCGAVRVQRAGKKLVLGMPAVWRERTWNYYAEQHDRQEGIFYQIHPDGYLIQNMESLAFLQEVVRIPMSKIRTDASLYVMNQEAIRWWLEQGITQLTSPWELTGKEWCQSVDRERQQVIIYGHIPLMVSAQCVAYNTGHCSKGTHAACNTESCGKGMQENSGQVELTGEQKRHFLSVQFCRYCYNIIYQGKPFSIQREVETLQKNGFFQLRYEFTVETTEQVQKILAGYVPEHAERGHYDQGVY